MMTERKIVRNLPWWFGVLLLMGIGLGACGSHPDSDCVRLTPSSRQCANPRLFADPPPASPLATAPVAGATGWTLSTPERAVAKLPTLSETVWTLSRAPFSPFDFIALRRIAPSREDQSHQMRPSFLFLPGAHCHGEILFPSEQFDVRIYLAAHGIETWTLDYRTHFVPREQIYDSAFMQAWTTEAFLDDVLSAVQRVREATGQQKIVLGGFGLGATFAALAVAKSAGEGIAGLVLLDGYVLDLPDEDPLSRERTPTPHWFADDLEGHYLPYKRWIKILQDVIEDPAGPDFLPVPVFDNRAQALAHFLYVNANFGGHGGLSNAQNGKADIVMLAQFLQHQDRYWPRVQNHGGFSLRRHLADSQFDYEKALRGLRLPLLAFASDGMDGGGIQWSERVQFTARATASRQVQVQVLHDWGYLDVLMGANAMHEVYRPIAEWIVRQPR